MKKAISLAAAVMLGGSMAAWAGKVDKSVATAPPADPYKQVSKLVALPDFIPGLGQLFVDPDTLPAGPFLAYDHKGKLVSSVYMLPLEDLKPEKGFDNLGAPAAKVDHVDVYYNAGHPAVEMPHAHVVLWHVSDGETRVAE